jgi:hypothetical protein
MMTTADLLGGAGMLPALAPGSLGNALDALAVLERLRTWPDERLRVLRCVRSGQPMGDVGPERLTAMLPWRQGGPTDDGH